MNIHSTEDEKNRFQHCGVQLHREIIFCHDSRGYICVLTARQINMAWLESKTACFSLNCYLSRHQNWSILTKW